LTANRIAPPSNSSVSSPLPGVAPDVREQLGRDQQDRVRRRLAAPSGQMPVQRVAYVTWRVLGDGIDGQGVRTWAVAWRFADSCFHGLLLTGSGQNSATAPRSQPGTICDVGHCGGAVCKPEPVRQPLIENHLTTAWKAGLYEDRNLYDEVAGELRRAPDLPDMPLIVLTVLGHDDTQAQLWPEETLRQIKDAKTTLHAQLAASVPHGEHQILDDAGHGWLHEDRPDAVLQAIADLLRKTRR
jgi:hypothetical protein